MKRTSSFQSENQQNFIYAMLPEARPLQGRVIPQPKSAFCFTAEPAAMGDFQLQPEQLIENVGENQNTKIHQIGTSLFQLFKNPVYQSYHQLQITEINNKFATCNFKIQPQQMLKPMQTLTSDESFLKFQSRFESGNLALATRSVKDQNNYFLALQRDTNSNATCQWYYFFVQNRNNLGIFTFNIVNMVKNYSAYQNGMKPCVLSVQSKQPWRRDGFNILYRKNTIPNRGEKNYFTLSFSYNFLHRNDRIYFAYSYPYTFSRMQNLLLDIQSTHNSLVQVKILAKTLKGNPVNILSITNPHSHNHQFENKKIKKDMLMICARVHPGQTNSSFACEGLIKFLLSDSEDANNIRTNYIIKIIPFLNPDGVIHGNYRTSLSGEDLNRKWKRPDKDLHPEIYAMKKYLNETSYRKALFIDLHGHSKKKSSFMYGCFRKQNPYLCKQLPFILSKSGHHFCYFNCNFTTPTSRQGTSRINIWKQFGVDYSYTMQISFCGPVRSRYQFRIKDYLMMGESLGKVMSKYFCGKKNNSVQTYNYLKQLYSSPEFLNQGIQQSAGSQSGQEQIMIEDKKQMSAKQNEKELKGILTKYLNESKTKWTRQNLTKLSFGNKKQQKGQMSLRSQRRELAPSRISIKKIDLSQQIYSPYVNFTLMKGNIRLQNKDLRHSKELLRGSSSKNSYCPYSFSKGKLNSKSNIQQALMLPKVLREQELKYRKYRRNQSKFQISLSHEGSHPKQESKLGQGKQISLTQKIFQNTHKQLQEAGRYWVRYN